MCSNPARRKILSGARSPVNGGIRPCSGPLAASPGDCCAKCVADATCNAWMFSTPFDCRAQGIVAPAGVCYLIQQYTGAYDPDVQAIEYWSGSSWLK